MTENAVHVSPMTGEIAPKTESFGVRHKRGFITAAVIGVLLAFLGALGTSQIGILPRLAYWQILMLSGAMIGLGVSEAVERWGRFRTQPWIEMPLIALLIALPLTMMVVGASLMFFSTNPPGAHGLATMFGITFIVSLAMTVLNYLIHWPGRVVPAAPLPIQPATQSSTPQMERQSRFAERLPLHLRRLEIIALQAEDHYLRVYFKDGQSTLILMRLSDAISELPAENGAQTHRSWWVAKAAVKKVVKADSRAIMTLDCGIEAPVSRSYYKALGEAGWLT
ncbi:MAG: LytTR family DNA-binding domain-containing protein [Sphingorhabdus sp.]